MGAIQDRLSQFLSSANLTTHRFERQCGIAVGAASRLTEKSYAITYDKIHKAFPELNIDWLKTGEGEMLLPHRHTAISISESFNNSHNHDINIGSATHNPINLGVDEVAKAPIVPQQIKCLPNLDVLEFMHQRDAEMQKCAVMIADAKVALWYGVDDNALAPNFRIGDLVALIDNQTKTVVAGSPYVIDTYSQGMILRFIIDAADDYFCMSLNPEQYADFTIKADDVIRIYKVIGMFRFNNNR